MKLSSKVQINDLNIKIYGNKGSIFWNHKHSNEYIYNDVSGNSVNVDYGNAIFEGNYDTNVATTRKQLTVFFSDIKNFTSTAESLQPETLTHYLNEYFSEMTAIALNYGATIDKYIGDALMVFFGDPESKGVKEDARAGVEMAIEMQNSDDKDWSMNIPKLDYEIIDNLKVE